MVELHKFLKPYKDAGALHCLFAPHRFVNDHVFLTKGNQLGVVLQAEGIDPECLTAATLESHTRRIAAAWRTFDERFRIYQYVIKQDHPSFERVECGNAVVRRTLDDRFEFLESKDEGLYSIRLFYVVLLEPGSPKAKLGFSNAQVIGATAADLKRNASALTGQVQSLQRTVDDLIGLQILSKAEVFQFFRLLANLDQDVAGAERLKYDSHVDFFLPSLPIACTSEGLRIGDAGVEVLSLREPPTTTFPNVLRDMLAIRSNFILCSEFKRVLNDTAITSIRTAQNHFHWSQWVSDIPSIVSMILNHGNRENVIADKSALNDVEDLDKTLARINNEGEYLGEFSLTVVLYGWATRRRSRLHPPM